MRQDTRVGEDVAKVTLSCEQAIQELFFYLDRALAGERLEALEAHLESCLNCCDRLNFNRSLDAFVRERLGDASLPDGIEERIRRAIGNRAREE
jgi:anti-sigma factor (TIGR02949 family)